MASNREVNQKKMPKAMPSRQDSVSERQGNTKNKKACRNSMQTRKEVKIIRSYVSDTGMSPEGLDSGNLSGIQQMFELKEDEQPKSTDSGYGSGSGWEEVTSEGAAENVNVHNPGIRSDVSKTQTHSHHDSRKESKAPETPERNGFMSKKSSKMSQSTIKLKCDRDNRVWNDDVSQRTSFGIVPTELGNHTIVPGNIDSNENVSNYFKDLRALNLQKKSATELSDHKSLIAQVNSAKKSVLKSVIHNNDVKFVPPHTVSTYPMTFTKTDLARNDGRIALMNKSTRISTFRFWPKPHIITGEILADCGFYYLNDRDRVKCVYCNLILRDWELGDDPVTEHRRFSQTCIFERYMSTAVPDNVQSGLGVSYDVPKYHNYAIEAVRLQTFKNWPAGKTQTPAVLARSGFLFLGDKDSVMCFFCGIKLVNWAAGDDPWFEHAKHSSSCTYVMQSKGQTYIDDVRRAARSGLNHLPTQPATSQAPANVPANTPANASSRDSDIEQYMNTPAVKSLIEIMMKPRELVIKALKKCVKSSGTCPDASTLMDKIFELEDGDDEDSDYDSDRENQRPDNQARESQIDTNTIANHNSSHEESMQGAVGGQVHTDSNVPQATGALMGAGPAPSFYQRDSVPSATVADTKVLSQTPSQDGLAVIDSLQKTAVRIQGSDSDEDIYSANTAEQYDISEDVNGDLSSLKVENEELQRARTCKVCLDEPANIVFLPCGHLTCCSTCSPAIRLCPICRALIRGTVRTFMA